MGYVERINEYWLYIHQCADQRVTFTGGSRRSASTTSPMNCVFSRLSGMNGFTQTIHVSRSWTRDYLGSLCGGIHRRLEAEDHTDYHNHHEVERDLEVAVNRWKIYNTDKHRAHQNVIRDTDVPQSKRRNF